MKKIWYDKIYFAGIISFVFLSEHVFKHLTQFLKNEIEKEHKNVIKNNIQFACKSNKIMDNVIELFLFNVSD